MEQLLMAMQMLNCLIAFWEISTQYEYLMIALSLSMQLLLFIVRKLNFQHHQLERLIILGQAAFCFAIVLPHQFLGFEIVYLSITVYCGRDDKLSKLLDCVTVAGVIILSSQYKTTEIVRSVLLGVILIVILSRQFKQPLLAKSSPSNQPQSNISQIVNHSTPAFALNSELYRKGSDSEAEFGILILDSNLKVKSYNNIIQYHITANNLSVQDLLLNMKVMKIDKWSKQVIGSVNDSNIMQILEKMKEKQLRYLTILDYQPDSHYMIRVVQKDGFEIQFHEVLERDCYIKQQYSFGVMKLLFSTLSHEFGTSLNYILALAQIESLNPHMKSINCTGQILHHIVLDMVDFNDILGHTFELNVTPIDVNQLLDQIAQLFDHQISSKGLSLEIENNCFNKIIFSDERRIKQILINLISNSQKFTVKGVIKVTVNPRDQQIEFSVSDTGIGMKNSEIINLRQKLEEVKLEMKISKNTAGFGLGTFLSNRIATKLNSKRLGLKFQQQDIGLKVSFVVDPDQFNVQISQSSSYGFMKSNGQSSSLGMLRLSAMQNGIFKMNKQAYTDTRKIELDASCMAYKKKDTVLFKTLMSQAQQSNDHLSPSRYQKQQSHFGGAFMRVQSQRDHVLYNEDTEACEQVNIETDWYDQQNRIYQVMRTAPKHSTLIIENPLPFEDIKINEIIVEQCNCKQFLIVDDEMINILALSAMLKQMGKLADHAFNGQDCLEKIEVNQKAHCQYKAIFMDINMPIMDGYQATQIITKSYNYPIIASTAFTDAETKDKCYTIGMSQFINKPIRKTDLEKIFAFLQIDVNQ